ncbi:LTA synthase family protein [Halalkalibacter okhensis]|uniref:LTA synthase family protein n=1 Tax=Halalkalibacter okhensis TaxID=333138 RepID=UPI000A010724|nr:LTA synthase family protein [Halalkalibacter okhensis]
MKHIHLYLVFLVILSIKMFLTRVLIFDDYQVLSMFWLEMGYVVLLLALIELLAKKGKMFFYLLVNLVLSFLLFSMVLYFDFFGIMVSHHALYQIHQVGDVSDSVWTLLRPIHFLYFIDFIILGLLYAFTKVRFVQIQRLKTMVAFIVLSLAVIGFHLFLSSKTVNYDSIAAAKQMGIFNYQVSEIYSDIQTVENHLAGVDLTNEQIRELKGLPEADAEAGDPTYFGVAEGRNIIVIQFESLQDFTIGLEIDGQEITPHLNQLVEEGLYFPKVYQQIGAGNTSDAEFLLNTSLYPPGSRGASEVYGDKFLPSLPRLLKREGYHTATFHTNKASFWNRTEMYEALGFDDVYDEDFFGTDDYILMGASDEVLYEKTMDKFVEFADKRQPFYANVITMTSHHPFELPEEKIAIDLPERFEGTFIENYLTSIHYADKAMGEFIDRLKEEGIWENSLIVTFGDHSGVHHSQITEVDQQLLAEMNGRDYWFLDRLNIPLMITAPGALEAEVISNVGGQIDLMPTMANLVGLSLEDHIHFGQDIINNEENLLGMRYYLSQGSLFNRDVLLTSEGDNGTAYDLDTGEIIGSRLDYQDEFERVIQLLNLSDSYADQLPERQ